MVSSICSVGENSKIYNFYTCVWYVILQKQGFENNPICVLEQDKSSRDPVHLFIKLSFLLTYKKYSYLLQLWEEFCWGSYRPHKSPIGRYFLGRAGTQSPLRYIGQVICHFQISMVLAPACQQGNCGKLTFSKSSLFLKEWIMIQKKRSSKVPWPY